MSILRHLAIMSLVAVFLTACTPSTDELAAEVRSDIESRLDGQGITITSFLLSHRGGNEYAGILETQEPLGQFTYAVDVVYDGRSFTWEIRQ